MGPNASESSFFDGAKIKSSLYQQNALKIWAHNQDLLKGLEPKDRTVLLEKYQPAEKSVSRNSHAFHRRGLSR